jgi:quercetin dioxygenase-like cupin family protein
MEIKRFVTAENADGTVTVREDVPVPDIETAPAVTTLYGWDARPVLPVRPSDLGPAFLERQIFAPLGGTSVNLIVFPPAAHQAEPQDPAQGEFEKSDYDHSGVVVGEGAPGTHRTDSFDLIFVLEGEVVIQHPGAEEFTAKQGDFVAQNGAMHRWENKSDDWCVVAAVVVTAEREAGT